MQQALTVSSCRQMQLIGRGVWLELLRRKDLYVLGFLMGLFLVAVAISRIVGIENASTATFLLNLGMSLAWFCGHILTLALASRQLPDELEKRTLYPLLAKPLPRSHYLFGKWASCSLCGMISLLALQMIAWFASPKMDNFDSTLLAQTLTLEMLSIALVAALAICASLFLPKAVNLTLLAILICFGNKLTGLITVQTGDGVFKTPVVWLLGYLPDFSKLNLITRYTDGIIALDPTKFFGLMFYAFIFIAASLAISVFVFEKRRL